MTRPACTSQVCNQGRSRCPFPVACVVSQDDDHGRDDMVFNRRLWVGLAAYVVVLVASIGAAWWRFA